MTPERWRDTLAHIKDNFPLEDEGGEHLEDDGGTDIEYVEFRGPAGLMRLEFVTRPLVLDKKTNYSNRIGSETAVTYRYSETEMQHQLIAYRWNEAAGEWVEVEAGSFSD